ncbi:MAG: ferritin-like domain-containing protein [Pseudomonadota bacterium]
MKNLFQEAGHCLSIADPEAKIAYGMDLVSAWDNGTLEWDCFEAPIIINSPGRLEQPIIVPPKKLKKRGFGSDKQIASLLHALAHIEITAVNLAWDSICRYPDMPKEYYNDWIDTAKDEGEHFLALRQQIQQLGFDYGDFPVHGELWNMAVQTGDNLMHRMAIVHRVLEARALDVVPFAVKKFQSINASDTAKVLTTIANDEVNHVAAGTRWYHYCCKKQQCDPDSTFFELIKHYLNSYPKGPFNQTARKSAGFSENELNLLSQYNEQYKKNNN